ncbi:MAG: GNAT family N-acetyltransferase [Rhodocyclaceae bacterium]|nr:GNAT family N-acetyltransferase [Rhodocyclaceae bacterium]
MTNQPDKASDADRRTGPTTIRPAVPADIAEILELVADYWQFEAIADFDRERLAPQLQRMLTDSRLGAAWVARSHGRVVAYLLAVKVFSLEHGGLTVEIDELYVLPGHRGLGIGGTLLDTAEAHFLRSGLTAVSLQVGRDNAAGHRFYRDRGYRARSGFQLLEKSLADPGPSSE